MAALSRRGRHGRGTTVTFVEARCMGVGHAGGVPGYRHCRLLSPRERTGFLAPPARDTREADLQGLPGRGELPALGPCCSRAVWRVGRIVGRGARSAADPSPRLTAAITTIAQPAAV